MNIVSAAKDINSEHKLARECAETAVEHAVKCGQLLLKVKDDLEHGEFMPWIEEHCSFPNSTGRLYMKAAMQIANGLAVSSLRGLFPSGAPGAKRNGNGTHTTTERPELPRVVEDYPDDEDEVEDPKNYRTSFLLRADQAIRFAVYSGPVSKEIVATARSVAKAWATLADNLEKTR